jgi:hypothetical protein
VGGGGVAGAGRALPRGPGVVVRLCRRPYWSTTSTIGGWPFQVQKTDTVAPAPSLKSTRSHSAFVHTCIDQPGCGVAETSFAEPSANSRTTLPPRVG